MSHINIVLDASLSVIRVLRYYTVFNTVVSAQINFHLHRLLPLAARFVMSSEALYSTMIFSNWSI